MGDMRFDEHGEDATEACSDRDGPEPGADDKHRTHDFAEAYSQASRESLIASITPYLDSAEKQYSSIATNIIGSKILADTGIVSGAAKIVGPSQMRG